MPTGVYIRDDNFKRAVSLGMKKYLAENPIARKHRGDAQRGVPRPEWVKRKISETHKKMPFSEEHKKHIADANRNRYQTENGKQHLIEMRKLNKGYIRTEKHRLIASHNTRRNWEEIPECYKDNNNAEIRQYFRELYKKRWEDKDYRAYRIRQMCTGASQRIKPNRIEKKVEAILNEIFPSQYKFTGNFEFMVGHRCPDFTNVNGKKKVIEIYGDYWHSEKVTGRNKNDEESLRIKHYLEYGFDCLILWEHEVNKTNRHELENIISQFHEKEVTHASS